jgi:hypothetical protein
LLLVSALFVVSRTALAQTAAGSFLSVSGPVQIQRTGGATIGAASGVGVNVGDRIITGANGHAVLILNDQSRLEVGPGTNIALDQFTVGGGPTRVSLFSGVMRSLVNAGSGGAGADYQVHTPNAVAAVRGTKFDTAYSENVIRPGYQGCEKYTDVSVFQGTVNLAQIGSPNTGEDVRAGYEATVPCDKPPTESGPLSMTGAVSLESANAGGASFAGAAPGSSAAPVPACPVCVSVSTTGTGIGGGGHGGGVGP